MKPYRGNKGVVTLFPKILGIMPKHKVYWELFAGSAQILKRKDKSQIDIAVELDRAVVNNYLAGMAVINDCAISLLDDLKHLGKEHLIYADPPYRFAVRRSGAVIYNCELTDQQHLLMLWKFTTCKCNVIISHYDDPFYDRWLIGWNKITTKVSYRGNIVTEALYYNFDDTEGQLHSTTRSGKNKDFRQRRKRKVNSWLQKFKHLPNYERQAIIEALAVEYNCLSESMARAVKNNC